MALMIRLWFLPDGTVRVESFPSKLSEADRLRAADRQLADGFIPSGSTWTYISETDLPSRSQRHKWRHQGGRIVVESSIPDLPDPRQALRDEVASATTIAALKAVLLKVLG